jgi:C4-dicarboxylate transporter DctQ subunit
MAMSMVWRMRKQLPVDVDVYGMGDNLHMHDLKQHKMANGAAAQERRKA